MINIFDRLYIEVTRYGSVHIFFNFGRHWGCIDSNSAQYFYDRKTKKADSYKGSFLVTLVDNKKDKIKRLKL